MQTIHSFIHNMQLGELRHGEGEEKKKKRVDGEHNGLEKTQETWVLALIPACFVVNALLASNLLVGQRF